jgi:microcin C transport system substrate-binding protein
MCYFFCLCIYSATEVCVKKSAIFFICFILFIAAFSCSGPAGGAGAAGDKGAQDFTAIMSVYQETKSIAGAGPQHGIALVGSLKYKPDFKHLDYADPNAKKGGKVTGASTVSFDSLNPFIIKGTGAPGMGYVYQTLMDDGILDEPSSEYGLIAESIEVPADFSSAIFKIRPEARWHDNTPITPEDVVFSFETLIKDGAPRYQQYYAEISGAKKTGDREVTFTFSNKNNHELPSIIGQLYVFNKKYYSKHPFNEVTLDPPLGSGPYEVSDVKPGKSITFTRVANYWAKDLPIMSGRYNWDQITYIVYQDDNVRFQGFKAGEFDFVLENSAKRWATEYTGPALDKGQIKKELIPDKSPQGLQGFVFNTRRDIFKDKRVREAISYAFDFEWLNKNIFYNQYIRTRSFYENSVFASYLGGLPSAKEIELLNPLKGKIPDEVFTKVFEPSKSDGSGNIRDNITKALALFEQAGWSIKDTKLVNNATGKQMEFEIMLVSPSYERLASPFTQNLQKMGINATYRSIDVAQASKRVDAFDFDMFMTTWYQSFSPGNEQREFWGSKAADQHGSQNYVGIKDPAIDTLIEAVASAKGFENLQAAVRALDRVLLYNYFAIPHYYSPSYRIAYWDRFGQPKNPPAFGVAFTDTWWIDPDKDMALKNK